MANGQPPPVQPRRDEPMADLNRVTGKADKYLSGQIDKAVEETPFLGTAGKETYDIGAGTMKTIGGVFTGDWDKAKSGLKQAGSSVLSAMTAGALRSLNKPPPRQYLGGSPEALAQLQQQQAQGLTQGNTLMGQGVDTSAVGASVLGQAGQQSMADRGFGYGVAGQGLAQQRGAVGNARGLAGQSTDSLAQLQLQQGLAQNQQAMAAQAAQARGGNQAAAMRGAQQGGVQAALGTNMQAAQLRAAEQQAALNRQIGVEQMASQVGGQQLGVGAGMAQQGTTQLGQVGSQIGSIGLGQGQLGLGSQGQFLGAQTDTNKAQLEADTKHASASQAAKGGVGGVVGKVIGGLFGGGG